MVKRKRFDVPIGNRNINREYIRLDVYSYIYQVVHRSQTYDETEIGRIVSLLYNSESPW